MHHEAPPPACQRPVAGHGRRADQPERLGPPCRHPGERGADRPCCHRLRGRGRPCQHLLRADDAPLPVDLPRFGTAGVRCDCRCHQPFRARCARIGHSAGHRSQSHARQCGHRRTGRCAHCTVQGGADRRRVARRGIRGARRSDGAAWRGDHGAGASPVPRADKCGCVHRWRSGGSPYW